MNEKRTHSSAVCDPWRTSRAISHAEAREIATRLINSHFNKEPHARVSIPARPDYDDDLMIVSYIKQQEKKSTAPAQSAGMRPALEKAAHCLRELGYVDFANDCLAASQRTLNEPQAAPVGPIELKPITMSDVRLMVGEGKLFPADVLNAVNAMLKMRQPHSKCRAQSENE